MSTPKHRWFVVLASGTGLAPALALVLAACGDEAVAHPDTGADAVVNQPETDGGFDAADAEEPRDPFDPADEPVTCAANAPCAKQITAGANHFCALMSDGTVRCWGGDEYGALGGGLPSKDPKDGPSKAGFTTVVGGLTDVTQISAGRFTTCARRDDGSVWCWGQNSHGQLGLDDVRPSFDDQPHATPEPVALHDPAVRVDVGVRNACAVLVNGGVSCWGTNEEAQLARPGASLSYVLGPGTAELAPLTLAKPSIGDTTMLGLTTSGQVVTWAEVAGTTGFLGGRMTSINPDPTAGAIPQLAKVTSLVATATHDRPGSGGGGFPPKPPFKLAHACALAGGEVYCWGRSDLGALGTGLPDEELAPAHAIIKGKAWPQQLAAGLEITCARMTDGTIQCCGADGRGRLGTGQKEPFSAFFKPVASFERHAVQVATSDHAVCALVKDGTVECWGGNSSGELATGTTDGDPHPSPVKVTF